MLKGKTRIELRNAETGELEEVREDENLITHAIDYIIDAEMSYNAAPNDYCLPVATKLLGGIMLFDDELDEDVDNIHFPVDVHLVGYAGQTVNPTDDYGGSYNTVESYKTETGFRSVWDFGTNQANGQIAAVARTSAYAGRNPLRYMYGPRFVQRACGLPQTDTGWAPIRYDGEYLYMLKGNSTTHLMRLAKVKMPIHAMGAADYSAVNYDYEVIASWDTSVLVHGGVTVYLDSPNQYRDGGDGYIYALRGDCTDDPQSGRGIRYFTICYGDDSYDKSAYKTFTIGSEYYYNGQTDLGYYSSGTRIYCKYFNHAFFHISDGNLYLLSLDRKSVFIIDMENPASMRSVRLIAVDSSDYIDNIHNLRPHAGGVYVLIYHYGYTSNQWENGIVYPDGTYVVNDIAGTSDETQRWGYCREHGDKLELLCNNYNDAYTFAYGWVANYLGTINNLSSVVTKTAAQTMRIIYTLTDVDE